MPFSRKRKPENGRPIQAIAFTRQTANTPSTAATIAASQPRVRRLVAAAVSAGLGVVALSPHGSGWFAWVALVPLIVALDGAGALETLGIAIVYAVVLGLGAVGPWLAQAAARYFALGAGTAGAWTAVFLLVVLAIHGTVLGLVLLGRPRRAGPWRVVWFAAAYPSWDAARSAAFPHFPGGVLALSQTAFPAALQVASLAGVAGVGFVVVAANAGLAALVAPSARRSLTAALTGVALAVVACGWGAARLAAADRAPSSPGPVVATVDADVRDPAASTLARWIAASGPALRAHPALLVWPESALATDVEHDRAAWETLRDFTAAHATPLLAGGPGAAIRPRGGIARFNSAHLVTPGVGLRSYHKRDLVPFAERWPAAWPSWLWKPPQDLTATDPGEEAGLLALGGDAFGVLVCFEIMDAGAARELARRDARFIVNPTNDAWYAEPPHLAWAAVRAVETGVPVVRAANTGVSAVFDRLGRRVAESRPAGAPATLAAPLPAARPTPFVAWGNAFPAACAAIVVAGFLSTLRGRGGRVPTGGGTPSRRHRGHS
jgi:apolipoprotein N-acyltransferase